ncbi:DEAD/DEAH box family ATP-dependent RNA helicase [Bacteroidota bacterium]|nr:DEAD/DEAH box family ATP-dependent RNA helicase [Bacteroidota bacterium]
MPTFVVLEQFIQLGIAQPIIDALSAQGYTTPTPIQAQAIPAALAHNDILGTAQTGTGKTAAFSIPIIQNLMSSTRDRRTIKALILTPTRELALQIDESIAAYSSNVKISHAVIFGGVNQNPQVDAIKRGVEIMTATPGRLLDLMQQGFIDLRNVEFFVLDEADRMLDMGFIHDVKKVIAKLPTKRQTLFFSATMPAEVVKLSQNILVNPVRVSVAPVSTTAEKVTQQLFYVDQKNKRFLLRHLLDSSAVEIPSVLVFTRTKHGADKVVKDLVKLDITTQAIHGNKSQNARQTALSNFKNRTTRVLVATDIAARGIDIDELTHVINYEIPNIPETYVHRIGRTGRAGNSGVAWSFVDREEVPFIKDIQKLIKQEIPVETSHPYLPGTHVAEANDAKPFYNDGNNGNQRVARKKANLRNDAKSGSPVRNDRRDQPSNDAPKPKPAGPAKPFTRFKPRD